MLLCQYVSITKLWRNARESTKRSQSGQMCHECRINFGVILRDRQHRAQRLASRSGTWRWRLIRKKDLLAVVFRRISVKYTTPQGIVAGRYRGNCERQRAQKGWIEGEGPTGYSLNKTSICQGLRVRARTKSKYARAFILSRVRDREIERERERVTEAWTWRNLLPRLSSTRSRVIVNNLESFKKYYRHVFFEITRNATNFISKIQRFNTDNVNVINCILSPYL